MLLRYIYNEAVKDYLPKNELLAGKRILKLSCQVKVIGGSHTLAFIVKKKEGGRWLAIHEEEFTKNEWTQVNVYFRIPPDENCFLVIDQAQRDMNRNPNPGLMMETTALTLRRFS